MDSRIDVADAFAVPRGSAHMIRNAGGSAREALRSIIISQQLLGTREIILVKHTQCGMATFNNEKGYEIVKENLSKEKGAEMEASKFDWLCFKDLDESVKEEVKWLRDNELVAAQGEEISGWVYDVGTGKVRKVA
jgi:carbonic anhydrase